MTLTSTQIKSFDNSEIDGHARHFDSSNLFSNFFDLDSNNKNHFNLSSVHSQTATVPRTLVNAKIKIKARI